MEKSRQCLSFYYNCVIYSLLFTLSFELIRLLKVRTVSGLHIRVRKFIRHCSQFTEEFIVYSKIQT